ncbi:MAG: hypothetical protein AAFQ82_25790 [Myxococcota bacterium]
MAQDPQDRAHGAELNPVLNGALAGAPVDERRPEHLRRDEYLEKKPGRNTERVFLEAGLRRRRTGMALAIALLVAAGTVCTLYLFR